MLFKILLILKYRFSCLLSFNLKVEPLSWKPCIFNIKVTFHRNKLHLSFNFMFMKLKNVKFYNK